MGVQRLHQFVETAKQNIHISAFANKTVAVDVSGWLHRGLFNCALDIERAQKTDFFLEFVLRNLKVLQDHKVTPLVVFDGAVLPQKEERAKAEGGRSGSRAEAREQAIALLRQGKQQEALQKLGKAVSVSPWMSTLLIEELKKRSIPFVVAPYEADPQLAFLVKTGTRHKESSAHIHTAAYVFLLRLLPHTLSPLLSFTLSGQCAAAISDDSDLLAYGCPKTLYNFNELTGRCMMVVYEDLRGCESTKGHFLFDGRWAGEWDDWSVNGMLINLCILSGTDYLPNRKGIGITGAHEALRAHKGDVRRALSSPPTAKQPSLKNKAKFGSGAELDAYLLQMDRVRAVFTHALVYDSMRHRVVPLNDLPPEGEGGDGGGVCRWKPEEDTATLRHTVRSYDCKEGM